MAIDDVRGLLPPLFGDEFLRFSDAVEAASIACCCFKACSVVANKVDTAFDDSRSVEDNMFCVRLGIPATQLDSFAATKRDAKLGVLEIEPDTAF